MANTQDPENREVQQNSVNLYDVLGETNKSAIDELNKQGATGSGAEAAVGTKYSWDTKGTEQANTQYQIDVLNAKQSSLENRRTIEENSKNYQSDADMMQYKYNQAGEKVGWTGGYVLDQDRQMEYLKAGIQAQLYGAMELQRYGYDTSLAAARLSYDLNQKEYAHKYYQDAVANALQEYPATGVYISAENRDMLAQSNIAQEKNKLIQEQNPDLFDEDGDLIQGKETELSQEMLQEYKRNKTIINNIDKWYETNGVSKQGRISYEAIYNDIKANREYSDTLWTRYYTLQKDFNDKYSDSYEKFMRYDSNNNPVFDGVKLDYIDFSKETPEENIEYANSSSTGRDQFYRYLDGTITDAVNAYVKNNTTRDANGLISTDNTTKEGLEKVIKDLFSEGSLKDYASKENLSQDLMKNYRYTNNELEKYRIDNFNLLDSDNFVSGKQNTVSTSVSSISASSETDSNGWTITASANADSGKLRFDFKDAKGGTEDIAVKFRSDVSSVNYAKDIIYDALELPKGHQFGTSELENMENNSFKLIKYNNKYVIVYKQYIQDNSLNYTGYCVAYSGTVRGANYNTTDKWKTGFDKVVNTLKTNNNYLLDISSWGKD